MPATPTNLINARDPQHHINQTPQATPPERHHLEDGEHPVSRIPLVDAQGAEEEGEEHGGAVFLPAGGGFVGGDFPALC